MICPNLYLDNATLVTIPNFKDLSDNSYPTDAQINVSVYWGDDLVAGPYTATYTDGDYQAIIPAVITTPASYSFVADGRLYEIRATSSEYEYSDSVYLSALRRISGGSSSCGC